MIITDAKVQSENETKGERKVKESKKQPRKLQATLVRNYDSLTY